MLSVEFLLREFFSPVFYSSDGLLSTRLVICKVLFLFFNCRVGSQLWFQICSKLHYRISFYQELRGWHSLDTQRIPTQHEKRLWHYWKNRGYYSFLQGSKLLHIRIHCCNDDFEQEQQPSATAKQPTWSKFSSFCRFCVGNFKNC